MNMNERWLRAEYLAKSALAREYWSRCYRHREREAARKRRSERLAYLVALVTGIATVFLLTVPAG